jgi:outer membrane protein assembly factor BamB
MKLLNSIILLGILFLSACGGDDGNPSPNPTPSIIALDVSLYQGVVSGVYEIGVELDQSNYVEIYAYVHKAGSYSFATEEVNGYHFSASGELTVGDAVIRLQAEGTPLQQSGDEFVMSSSRPDDVKFSIQVLSNLSNKIIFATGGDSFNNVWNMVAFTGRGEFLWQKPGYTTFAAIDNDIIYASNSNALMALSIYDGSEIWSNINLANMTTMTLNNNVLYIGNSTSDYTAVNALNGEVLWTYDPGVPYFPQGAPIVGSQYIYLEAGTDLHALNIADGSLAWTVADVVSVGTPVLDNDRLYICSGNKITVLNATDGSLIWGKNVGSYESPALANGNLYFVGSGLNCYNLETGDLIWNTSVEDIAHSPVVYENQVLVTTDFGFTAIYSKNAANGENLWDSNTSGFAETSLLVHDATIMSGSNNAVVLFNPVSGEAAYVYGANMQGSNPLAIQYDQLLAAINIDTKVVGYPAESGMD